MSRDNTVIVLKTKGKNGNSAEYRVAEVQCADNMYTDADYPSQDNPLVNRGWMLRVFNDARVFTDAGEAMVEAVRLYQEVGWVQWGICPIDLSNMFFPARRQRRPAWRRDRAVWEDPLPQALAS